MTHPPPTEPTLVSVCVATYRRPQLLHDLLRSLAAQELPPDCRVEVVVVDNDREASARSIVERSHHGLEIRYEVQPERNISLTRNRSLNLARGDVIAIIDDDETAGPHWIAELLAALDRYDADVVLAPVLPRFEYSPPRWKADSPYFNLYRQPSGTPVETGGAGNCAFHRRVLELLGTDGDSPFDPALGRTGGEDTDLFERLHHRGARLVLSQEAWVEEFVPADRLRTRWLVRRAFRTGSGYAHRRLRLSTSPLPTRARLAGRALGVLGLSTLRTLTSTDSVARGAWALRAVSAAGQLTALLGLRVHGY